MNKKVYNKKAIDYTAGFDIYDPETKKKYPKEEAELLPKEIKSRLINKPRKMGGWVDKI